MLHQSQSSTFQIHFTSNQIKKKNAEYCLITSQLTIYIYVNISKDT